MAFKKFSKRKNSPEPVPPKDAVKRADLNLTFKQKLFLNNAEGLFNISLWLPFFAASWLVSGLINQQYQILTLVFFPLMFSFLYTEKQLKNKTSFAKNYNFAFIVLALLYAAFIYQQDQRLVMPIFFFIAVAIRLLMPIFKFESSNKTFINFIYSSFSPFAFYLCLVSLGMFSQRKDEMTFDDLKYLILVLIPGTVILSREFLIRSDYLKKKGWKFENIKNIESKTIKRPGGISRLIIGLMIIGPAIPALLLPFDYIPRSLFLVSLCFFIVPKLAEAIQAEVGTLEVRVIALTKYFALVVLLTFLGAFFHSA